MQADKLQVKIFASRSLMGKAAAGEVEKKMNELLAEKEEINIIFAAAPSQNEFLESLCGIKTLDWNRVNAFHMDEYIGLPQDAPQGFGNFLRSAIFDKLPFKNVYYLNGNTYDLNAECERYAGLLKKNPPDIVCMGIGENAHIAFNDPHVANFSDPAAVKVVDLDEACRWQQVNDGCFSRIEDVPTHALTLTIPALVKADNIFCMVPGPKKAAAVQHTIYSAVSEKYPSTILRNIANSCLYIDVDSAANF